MKKNLYLTLTLFLLFISYSCSNNSNEGNIKNDLEGFLIKSKAKSMTDTIWNVSEKFGELIRDDIEKIIKVNFNDDGNIIDITTYNSEGVIIEKEIKKWNGKILKESFVYGEDGKQKYHHKYTFDNEKLKKIETECTIPYENWTSVETYHYSSIEPDRIDSIKTIKNNGDKDLYTFKYLDKNTRIQKYILATGETHESTEYFNDKDQLIKDVDNITTVTYAYNDQGLCVKRTFADGIVDEYEYEFDAKGSLIKQIHYVKDESSGENRNPVEMYSRHIEYE